MAQVTLNKNSWHFQYYSMIVSDTPPKTLCPYFWTMVAILIMSPIVGLIFLISFIMKHVTDFFDKVTPKKEKKQKTFEDLEAELREIRMKREQKEKFWNKAGDVTSWTFGRVFVPLLFISLLYLAYRSAIKIGWLEFFVSLGIGLLLMSAILGIVFLIEKFGGRVGRFILMVFQIVNPLNWKAVKILGEMINAAYTKACPLITWEENKEESLNKI
jgi:hypothetical protein